MFHVTGQTMEAITAVSALYGFFVNFIFHERVVIGEKAGEPLKGVALLPVFKRSRHVYDD
jgi:hypothetical protein